MKRSLFAHGWLLALLLAGIAFAAPFTTSFDALRAELVRSRDQDFAGVLSSTQRKQLAAVNACIGRIDGPHASVIDDAKTLKFVGKKLLKPFAGQFDGSTPGPLPGLVAGSAQGLLAQAESLYGTVQAAIDAAVDPAHRQQASELAAQARAYLDEATAPETPPATAAALLIKAAKTLAGALAIADDRPASGVRCTIGSRAFVATEVLVFGGENAGSLLLSISAKMGANETLGLSLSGQVGELIEIGAYVFPFTNSCVYNPDGGENSFFYSQFSPKSFARINSFDPATGTATGTFSIFMMRSGNERLQVKKGVFNVTVAVVPKR